MLCRLGQSEYMFISSRSCTPAVGTHCFVEGTGVCMRQSREPQLLLISRLFSRIHPSRAISNTLK